MPRSEQLTLRTLLKDFVPRAAVLEAKAMAVRIEATPEATMLRGHRDSTLFLKADLPPHPDLVGSFGIGSPGLLEGLLQQFTGEDAGVAVERHVPPGEAQEVVSAFRLTSSLGKAVYRTMSAKLMAAPTIRDPEFAVDVEPEPGALDEFARLARLLPDKTMTARADGEHLLLSMGEDSTSTHGGHVIIAKTGVALRPISFKLADLADAMRGAGKVARVAVSSKTGILRITSTPKLATYHYYLRATF